MISVEMPALRRRSILALLAPAAAGGGRARASARQSVSFWTMQLAPFHSDYVQGLVARFEARHPGVRVHWVDVPWAEMERKVLASLAAGTAPDVVNLNPQFSARLAELGALADPREHLQAPDIAAFLPSAWAANALGGVPFALPWYLSTTVTLARRDLLERAGQEVPRDFPGLLRAAQALRARTGSYAWFPALDGSAPLEAMVAMTGSLLARDRCRPSFEGAPGEEVFGFYRELYERRWIPPSVLTEGHRSAVAQFLAGQVAMVSTGMQFIGQLRTGHPALHAQVVAAPQWLSGGARPNIAAMNLAVPRASREPALAFEFARFVTAPDNQLELVRRVPLLPSTRASYDDPLFSRPAGADALLDAAREISVRQVFDGEVQVPPMRRYHKLRTSYVRALHGCMLGRATPRVAVQEVVRAWVPLLGCAA